MINYFTCVMTYFVRIRSMSYTSSCSSVPDIEKATLNGPWLKIRCGKSIPTQSKLCPCDFLIRY